MPLLPPLVPSPRPPSSAAGGVADADCPNTFVSGSGEPLYPDGLHSLRSICSTCLYLALLPEGSMSATSPLESQPMATGVHSKMRHDDPGRVVMLRGVPQLQLQVQGDDDDESALTARKVFDVSSSQVSSHRSISLPFPLPPALRLPPHLAARSAPTLMARTLLGSDPHDLENNARRGEPGTVSVDVFDASIPASEASGSDAEDPDLSCRPAGHSLPDADASIGESATTGHAHAVIVHAAHHPRPISSRSSLSISSISIDEVEEGSEDTWMNEHFELVTHASPPPRTSHTQSFIQPSYQPTRTLRSYRHQRARNLNLTVNTSLGLRDLQNPPMSPSPLPESELEQGNVYKEGEDGVIPFAFHLDAQDDDDDDFFPNPSSESLPSSPSSSLFPSSPSSFGSLRSRTYSHFFSISALSIDIAIPSSADVDELQSSHLAIAPWTPQSCSTETSYGEPLEYEKEQRGQRVDDPEVDTSEPALSETSGAVDEASLVRLADQDGQDDLVLEMEADEEVGTQIVGLAAAGADHTTEPIEPSHRSSLTRRLGSFVARRFSLRGRRATVSAPSAPSLKDVPRTRPLSFAGPAPINSMLTNDHDRDTPSYALVLHVDDAERGNETQGGSRLTTAGHSRTQTFTPTVADIPPSLFPPSLIAPTSPSPRASLELDEQDVDAPTHFPPSLSPKPRSSKRVSFEPRLSTETTSQRFSFSPMPSSPLGWEAQSSEAMDDRTTMTVHIEHASPGPVARLLQRFNSLSRSRSPSSRNRSRSGSSSTPFVLAPPVMRALPTAGDFRSADEEDEQVFVFGNASRRASMNANATIESDDLTRVEAATGEPYLASPDVKPVTPEQMRRWSA